jgi:hypothetical protein
LYRKYEDEIGRKNRILEGRIQFRKKENEFKIAGRKKGIFLQRDGKVQCTIFPTGRK